MVIRQRISQINKPYAITMWDFSWIERRWTGAGYEDWELILDELADRGYNAVRIDAFPHFIAYNRSKTWELIPCWKYQCWGSPGINRISNVEDALIKFIKLCRDRDIKVALSTWFREDHDNVRMNITTPEELGRVWMSVLDLIDEAGLSGCILYVDLCNEFPLSIWAPFLYRDKALDLVTFDSRTTTFIKDWMHKSIDYLRSKYPEHDYCFSFCTELNNYQEQDVTYFDLLEPHIWMSGFTSFWSDLGFTETETSLKLGYDLLQKSKELYYSDVEKWHKGLLKAIHLVRDWSIEAKKPLVTTECWAVGDYCDYPLLDWEWVKKCCEFGVCEALKTKRWVAIATSNYCGPQFVGMWRDIEWHKKITTLIRTSECGPF